MPPDLLQFSQEGFVILDMPKLIGMFVVSDCSFLPDLQFTQGDIVDLFEILLVVRKKM